MSMALTPGLAELGKVSGDWLEGFMAKQQASDQPMLDALAVEASNQTTDDHKVSRKPLGSPPLPSLKP